MFESQLVSSDLVQSEKVLNELKFESQSNFDSVIAESKRELIERLKSKGLILKRLCTHLTIPNDGTASAEDVIERQRIVITTTAHTGAVTFTLKGCNTLDGAYTTATTISVASADDDGVFTDSFTDYSYKYYKLTASGTVTFTAYLVEVSFELAHKYLTLYKIFFAMAMSDSMYATKAELYQQMYDNAFQTAVYSYDKDDSGSIDENEQKVSTVSEMLR